MQHQVGMRMRHGGEHAEHQAHARIGAERMPIAPAIDRLAVDVFEHEVRLAAAGHARIEQSRDVRMLEPRQRRAFTHEATPAVAREQCEVEQLDRDLGIEATIAALGQPDAAHAASAERTLERVGANRAAGERCCIGRHAVEGMAGEEALALDRLLLREQPPPTAPPVPGRCSRARQSGLRAARRRAPATRRAAESGAASVAGRRQTSHVPQLWCPVPHTSAAATRRAGTAAPCSSRAAPCARRRRESRRSRRRRTRRRT